MITKLRSSLLCGHFNFSSSNHCSSTIKTVYTIANFGSVILVTVTVTRKMLTMILSVVWYGHSLTEMQWLGVGLVFGGIGVEAKIKHQSEVQKAQAKAKGEKKA